ncbi:hypothetical protein LCGC14_0636150 [marine sediment metagenome]|uniref:Uncharacterized protein n=1 Tax=marine sediment metagenome TaxID=412755 RepID=A0A0F9RJU4_9ZZZZ|nr:hypothetical protein [bacterium]
MVNTIPELDTTIVNGIQSFAPDNACFDWCLNQQVVHSNNLELETVLLVFGAYIMIVLYSMDDVDFCVKYRNAFIYIAKLMLIAFFVIYILVIRLRIYY